MTGRTFTSEQLAALDGIAAGGTFEAAAGAAGVTTRTLRRWRVDPVFAEAVQQARRVAREETAARVRDLVPRAVAVLDEVLTDAGAPATARLKAADIVLRRALDEPDEQDPPAAVREPGDPLFAEMDRALGREPAGAILWPEEG